MRCDAAFEIKVPSKANSDSTWHSAGFIFDWLLIFKSQRRPISRYVHYPVALQFLPVFLKLANLIFDQFCSQSVLREQVVVGAAFTRKPIANTDPQDSHGRVFR